MLTVLCGLPYSGKSTYVLNNKRNGVVVISLSNIRDELGIYDQNSNRSVASIAKERVEKCLKEGKDVIYDSTNVLRVYRESFISIAKELNMKTCIVFFDKPIEELIYSNQQKNFPFSNDVIINMHSNLEIPQHDEADEIIRITS